MKNIVDYNWSHEINRNYPDDIHAYIGRNLLPSLTYQLKRCGIIEAIFIKEFV